MSVLVAPLSTEHSADAKREANQELRNARRDRRKLAQMITEKLLIDAR